MCEWEDWGWRDNLRGLTRISRAPNQMVFALLSSGEVAGVWFPHGELTWTRPWESCPIPSRLYNVSFVTNTDTNCTINCNLFFGRCRWPVGTVSKPLFSATSISASYSGEPWFKFRPPRVVLSNAAKVPQIKPWLLPSVLFSFRYQALYDAGKEWLLTWSCLFIRPSLCLFARVGWAPMNYFLETLYWGT